MYKVLKKVFIYILALCFILFVIPSIFTTRKRQAKIVEENNPTKLAEEPETSKYEYTNYSTIRLYHTETEEVEELPIDEYLYGVVSSEMPADFEIEALKAQAVVARTYTIYQISHSQGKHPDADICDDYSCCQAWISKDDRLSKWDSNIAEANWEKIVTAVNSTQGKIITYNGEPIDAFFHSNSGGITETANNVWGGQNFPYLESVETSGENEYSQYNSEVEITKDDLIKKLKAKHSEIQIDWSNTDALKILDYTESGRVKQMQFGNVIIAGTEVRSLLGLKSTNFNFEILDNSIKFSVIGYGHGVGMSQTGADSLAKQNYDYEKIIKHFYKDVEITYL